MSGCSWFNKNKIRMKRHEPSECQACGDHQSALARRQEACFSAYSCCFAGVNNNHSSVPRPSVSSAVSATEPVD